MRPPAGPPMGDGAVQKERPPGGEREPLPPPTPRLSGSSGGSIYGTLRSSPQPSPSGILSGAGTKVASLPKRGYPVAGGFLGQRPSSMLLLLSHRYQQTLFQFSKKFTAIFPMLPKIFTIKKS